MYIGDDGVDSVRIGRANTTGAKIHIRSGADSNLVVHSNKVGIGTETPGSELDVVGDVDISGSIDVDGTANLDNTDIDGTLVVDGSNISLDSTATLNIDCSNTSNGVTIATATSGVPVTIGHSTSEVTVADNLTVTGNLTVSGTHTVVDTVTMNAANAIVFEGATADAHESTLTIIDPTGDRTIKLPNQSGCLPVLASDSATAITATPAELNYVDGVTSSIQTQLDSKGATAGSSSIVTTGALDSGSITSGFGTINTGSSTITTTGLITGGSLDIDDVVINGSTIGHTNDTDLITVADGVVTVAGELDATSLDVSGDVDIDGTCEADAYTVNGQNLNAFVAAVTVDAATLAATFTCTDNENANEDCPIVFVDGATGAQGAETDGDLHYNPSTGTITTTNLAGTITTASQTNITGVGTIGTGTWQGTAIASAYLDADTAHLSGTQTFSGAKTFTAAVTVGANDSGHDVIFYGDTASANLTWDTSADDLILNGAAGLVVPDGQLTLGSTAVSSTAAELNVLDGLNRGHVIVGNASNAPTSLAEGSENQVLTIDANGDAVWADASGGGGTFPGSATDNALTRFNGTGGSTVQNSGALLDDSNNLTTPGNITVGGGTAADHYFAIDGNAADWRVGVDDSADLFEIGSGTTAAANVAMAVNSDGQITTRRLEVAKKTADYDLVFGTDHVILVDTSGGEYDISLPHVTAEMDGHTYIIKDINDCSVNNIIIDLADSGDKIEGTTNGTYVMNSPRESVTVLVRWIAAGGGFGDHFII